MILSNHFYVSILTICRDTANSLFSKSSDIYESQYLFFLLFTIVIFSPFTQVEANDTIENYNRSTQFSLIGSATTVELVGEWNWDEPISMTGNNGVWTGELNLTEGIYCYKFIADGNIFLIPFQSFEGLWRC